MTTWQRNAGAAGASVSIWDGPRAPLRLLARFYIAGDVVTAEWIDDEYKADVELNGIYIASTGTVRPADGRPFMEALMLAYSNSTRMIVAPIAPSDASSRRSTPSIVGWSRYRGAVDDAA